MTTQTNKWVRNNGETLEILNFDPNGKWADGIPFTACPVELEPFLDTSYKVNEEGKIVPPSLDYIKAQVLAKVAEKRYMAEVGGIVLPDGSNIKTDRESQAQLSSAYTSLKNGLIASTPWKVANGTFVPVTLEMIEPIAQAVAGHVSACFGIEETKSGEVMALETVEAVMAYDTDAGWEAVRPVVEAPAEAA